MFNLKSILIVLMCAGMVSCAKETRDENNRPEGTTRTSSVAFAAEGVGDLSVYVFNKNDNSFLFHSVIDEGWIERDNKKILFKELNQGDYKFLFLANRCQNLSLPDLPTRDGALRFEDMIISHKELSSHEGCFAGADEIYMQDDFQLAGLPHSITGNKTIEAHLTRAVGKIEVRLARGYKSTDTEGRPVYIPVPYSNGKSIADLFQGYEIQVTDCGDHLSLGGCTGKASVYEDYAAGHEAIRTIAAGDEDNADGLKTGFAVLSGPFILPPGETNQMKVRIKLIPSEGADIPEFERELVNGTDGNLNIPRNHKLTITLWLDTVSPVINLTADITDMDKENTGDSGIWN